MILSAKDVLDFQIFMIYLLIVNNSSKKVFCWMANQWPATINYLKHILEISWIVCAQLSCLYSRYLDVDSCESHFVIEYSFRCLQISFTFFFFSSASQACAAHDCLFSKPKHKFSADLSPLAEGDSSVHSSHSFMYSKTFPPHLSSLSLLNKHASGHWGALVRPTRWHLCKPNEFIPLQSPCVSQRVGFSIPCGLVFSRVEKRKNEKMQVLFPSSALMLFLLSCAMPSLWIMTTLPQCS